MIVSGEKPSKGWGHGSVLHQCMFPVNTKVVISTLDVFNGVRIAICEKSLN
jgi:hypothetical protein